MTCAWKSIDLTGDTFQTECGHTYTMHGGDTPVDLCPFCGTEIADGGEDYIEGDDPGVITDINQIPTSDYGWVYGDDDEH